MMSRSPQPWAHCVHLCSLVRPPAPAHNPPNPGPSLWPLTSKLGTPGQSPQSLEPDIIPEPVWLWGSFLRSFVNICKNPNKSCVKCFFPHSMYASMSNGKKTIFHSFVKRHWVKSRKPGPTRKYLMSDVNVEKLFLGPTDNDKDREIQFWDRMMGEPTIGWSSRKVESYNFGIGHNCHSLFSSRLNFGKV